MKNNKIHIVIKILIPIIIICVGIYFFYYTFTTVPKEVPPPHPPHFIAVSVYKTKGDYSHLVPVDLSSDRSTVSDWPHTGSFNYGDTNGEISMHKGYLAQGMWGPNPYSAFLKVTISDFIKMQPDTQTSEKLYSLILDKNPFTELYNCYIFNAKTEDQAIEVVNSYIDNNELSSQCESQKV